jgi:hypothetical protein
MKDGLRVQHFPSYDAVVRAVTHWATSAGANFYERGTQAVHRSLKCIANGGDYVEKVFVGKNLLYKIVLLCSLYVSIVVSTEINRRHYFRSDPRIYTFLLPYTCYMTRLFHSALFDHRVQIIKLLVNVVSPLPCYITLVHIGKKLQ